MPILQGVEDAVSNSNFKVVGESVAAQVSLQRDEAVAHWSAMNKIREAAITRGVQNLVEDNPSQAMSDSQLLTGNAVAQQGSALALAAALAQILGKTGDNTPPQTGTQKV